MRHIYPVYEREPENAEVISEMGQVLLLTDLGVVYTMSKPAMTILVKEKTHNHAVIANGIVHFDNTTNNDYEELKSSSVEGDRGYATVDYIAMACAVAATVDVHSKNFGNYSSTDGPEIPLFGSIVARYRNTYGPKREYPPITLFKVSSNESIRFVPCALSKNPALAQLTRALVAVPAYASLVIETNLWEKFTNKLLFCGSHEQLAYSSWTSPSDDVIPCKDYGRLIDRKIAYIHVEWEDPFMLIHSSNENRLQQQWMRSQLGFWHHEHLLEVFSVFIGRENDGDLSVSGMIKVKISSGTYVIFDRDEKNPDRLLDRRKLLSITGRSEFMFCDDYFYIRVELKDAGGLLLIKDGYMSFHVAALLNTEFEYDRLLCKVIKGVHGYCALHYTIYRGALRMEVKCVLVCKGIDVARIYGKVVACSDIFDYSSDYNKKYFRKILFDKLEGDIDFPRKVVSKKTEDSFSNEHQLIQVELSRSCVAMPVASTLCIDVDLYASSHLERGPKEHLKDSLQFRLGDESPLKIEGEDYHILLHLEWFSRPY